MQNLLIKSLSKSEFWAEITKPNAKNSFHKLKNAKVSIAGAGGIGSNLALLLARVGVGNLHIVDFDAVELKNLNRQSYFLSDIGLLKIAALKSHINAINPYINVHIENKKITKENVCEIFKNDDIICEAFDAEATKAMFVDEILSKFTDKFLIATSGMSGMEILPKFGVRKLGRKLFVCGDLQNNDLTNDGLMAPKVMLCAANAANVVLNLIVKGDYE